MALSKVNPNFVEQTPYGRRNLIINGAMQVAQRGTSVTGITASPNYCTVDRFLLSTVVGTLTAEQSTDAPDGFSNSFKISCTTAESTGSLNSGDYIQLQQRIEGQNLQHLAMGTSNAKPMTLSFWVKSNITGTGTVELQQKDNSDRQVTPSYTINSADTWEYKTISIPADTSGLINNDNGMGMWVLFWLQSGSAFTGGTNQTSWTTESNPDRNASNLEFATSTSDYFAITGLQLEVGDTATPFEHRSFGEEWDACQRYCTVYNVGAGNTHPQNLVSPNHPVPGAPGHNDVPNRPEWFMSYPVKRATPTITVSDPTFMRWLASSNVVQDGNGSVTFPVGTGHQNANCFQGVASGIALSNVPLGWVHNNGGTYPKITIDAEL